LENRHRSGASGANCFAKKNSNPISINPIHMWYLLILNVDLDDLLLLLAKIFYFWEIKNHIFNVRFLFHFSIENWIYFKKRSIWKFKIDPYFWENFIRNFYLQYCTQFLTLEVFEFLLWPLLKHLIILGILQKSDM